MLRRGWTPVVVALSAALVLLAAAWPAGGARAAAGCTVELSWSGQDAAVGSDVQLQVRLLGAVDVYAAEVHFRYDPARLEATATRAEAGDLFGGKRTFTALNEVDAVEGKVAYAVTLLGAPAGVTGDGVLCRVKVRAKARGDAGLAIESVRLLDSKAIDIKCSLSVIPLTIEGSAGGGPSPGGGASSGGSPPAGGVPSGSAPGGTPAGGGTAGGSAGGGGGGGSSPASGSAAPASGGVRFEDTVGHWAEQAISFLAGQGIVAGVGEGRFCPDEQVTREQFTKMLVLALGEEPVAAPQTGMEDLPAGRWSAGYVARGVQMGFISGYREGGRVLFKPGQPITRAEMACMMVRALDLRLVLPQTATFRDVPLHHWAAPYVEAAYRAGLVTGVAPGLFAPEDPATRAQACVIVARMLGQR